MNLMTFILTGGRENPADKIPWNDPDFSRRMLEQHLGQEHDWASRRASIIDAHVAFIHSLLPGGSASILDLACGPGLYTERLAALGHDCVGVDFSPASVEYAVNQAGTDPGAPRYVLGDIRAYQGHGRFDCVLLTFGEINVFTREDARAILAVCAAALRPGGLLVLEAHTLEAVREAGLARPVWSRLDAGLFSDQPHLMLQEHSWDEERAFAATRYFIVDGKTAEVRGYGSGMWGYDNARFSAMLREAGFAVEPGPGRKEWPEGRDFEGKLAVWVCRYSPAHGEPR